MEQYRDQPAHAEKIAYQQKLLQEDVVHIRAEISKVSTVRHNDANNEKYSFFHVFVKVKICNIHTPQVLFLLFWFVSYSESNYSVRLHYH